MEKLQKFASVIFCFFLGLLIVSSFYVINTNAFDVNFKSIIPSSDNTKVAIAIDELSENNANKFILIVSGKKWEELKQEAIRIQKYFIREGFSIEGLSRDSLSRLKDFYRPIRHNFLSKYDASWIASASQTELEQRAIRHLYSPLPVNVFSWVDDPFGFFQNFFQAQNPFPANISVRSSFLTAEKDGMTYVVFPLSTLNGGDLSNGKSIQQVLSSIAIDPKFNVWLTGIPVVAESISAKARLEAQTIGMISIVLILASIIVFYGRAVPIVLGFGTLAVSFVSALTITVLVSQRVHLLTVVFGMTLLGIAVDYIFHYLSCVYSGITAEAAVKKLICPLALSLVTTILSYGVMLMVPLPLIRQMAVFCIAGLTITFSIVIFLFPLLPLEGKARPIALDIASYLNKGPRLQGKGLCVAVLFFLVIGAGQFKLEFSNELSLLNSIPPQFVEANTKVQSLFPMESSSQFFVIKSQSEENLFKELAKLESKLDQMVEKQIISGYRNPIAGLTDVGVQRKNRELIQKSTKQTFLTLEKKLGIKIKTVFTKDSEMALREFIQKAPVRLEGAVYDETRQEYIVLVGLYGVTKRSLEPLSHIAKTLKLTDFVDVTDAIEACLKEIRGSLLRMLVIAWGIGGLFLGMVYKRQFVRIVLPPIIASMITLGIYGWLGINFSIFVLIPLFLLFGLGLDYGILITSQKNDVHVRLSLLLAALSSLLSFGLLSFSSTPALRLFGLTVLIGLTTTLMITFLVRLKQ